MPTETPATQKGERTKERILAAALELFKKDGYEATTMRMVADAAGVSLGNAYYYFASKELLLQAFFQEVHEAHLLAAAPVLAGSKSLHARLLGVLLARLSVFEQVLAGSSQRLPRELLRELPPLLWTCSMGIVLYWIHDDSPGRGRTRALIEHSSELIVQLIRLASNPLLRPLRRRVLAMLADLQQLAGAAG